MEDDDFFTSLKVVPDDRLTLIGVPGYFIFRFRDKTCMMIGNRHKPTFERNSTHYDWKFKRVTYPGRISASCLVYDRLIDNFNKEIPTVLLLELALYQGEYYNEYIGCLDSPLVDEEMLHKAWETSYDEIGILGVLLSDCVHRDTHRLSPVIEIATNDTRRSCTNIIHPVGDFVVSTDTPASVYTSQSLPEAYRDDVCEFALRHYDATREFLYFGLDFDEYSETLLSDVDEGDSITKQYVRTVLNNTPLIGDRSLAYTRIHSLNTENRNNIMSFIEVLESEALDQYKDDKKALCTVLGAIVYDVSLIIGILTTSSTEVIGLTGYSHSEKVDRFFREYYDNEYEPIEKCTHLLKNSKSRYLR